MEIRKSKTLGCARWLIIITLLGLIFIIISRYHNPALTSLLVIPVSVSAALINVPAATATAAGQTLLLAAAYFFFDHNDMAIAITISLALMWITLGILNVIYGHINSVAHWAWERYTMLTSFLRTHRIVE
jgi:hypothetical protein